MSAVEEHLLRGARRLRRLDPELFELLEAEAGRQDEVLSLVASSSVADPAALVCEAMPTMNVTAEGYPGARFHAGCRYIDRIEQLAIDRAKAAFGAAYANVQPMSATVANQVVMFSVLEPGDTLLGMRLEAGGHLTHGAAVSYSGRVFNAVGYGLDADHRIDYEEVRRLALEHRPRLIVCGTTAYPRQIDWARFRAVADEVGAYLLADITHIAGLVAAGLHPSPVDHAHFTTTCTHKQLYGGRGGLILMGRDHDARGPGGGAPADGEKTLARRIQSGVFPFFQGAPNESAIAAKARGLGRLAEPEFGRLMERVVGLSRGLAAALERRGARVVTGGTDNHIVLVDVRAHGLTGYQAEKALEESGLIVNKNVVPNDPKPPTVASGIRLGTNSLAVRGLDAEAVESCVELIERVLRAARAGETDRMYHLDPAVRDDVAARVRELCRRWPAAHDDFQDLETP